jgi:hypothetical protein
MRLSVVDRHSQTLRCRGRWNASAMVLVAIFSAATSQAPPALADPVANFRNAVATARSGSGCGPLRYNSVVEQAADISLRSLVDYIKHTATRVPVEDPLPGLKTLGYPGNKGKLLSGAAKNDADSIKGALLEGSVPPASTIDTPKKMDPHPPAITDCSYTDFGVSMTRDETSGYYLSALVLAGS